METNYSDDDTTLSYDDWPHDDMDDNDGSEWEDEKESEWIKDTLRKIKNKFDTIRNVYENEKKHEQDAFDQRVQNMERERRRIYLEISDMKNNDQYEHELSRRTTFINLLQNPSNDTFLNESRQIQLEQINEFLGPYDDLKQKMNSLARNIYTLKNDRLRLSIKRDLEISKHIQTIQKRYDHFVHVAHIVDSFSKRQLSCQSSVQYRILNVHVHRNNQKPHNLPACITVDELKAYIIHIYEIEKGTSFQLSYMPRPGKREIVTEILPPNMTTIHVEYLD